MPFLQDATCRTSQPWIDHETLWTLFEPLDVFLPIMCIPITYVSTSYVMKIVCLL